MTDLKQLAEWSAEFLGWKHAYAPPMKSKYFEMNLEYDWKDTAVDNFFHDPMMAPYSMSLGKREMEKRGVPYGSFWNGRHYMFRISVEAGEKHHFDESEFIAFWTAVREALK